MSYRAVYLCLIFLLTQVSSAFAEEAPAIEPGAAAVLQRMSNALTRSQQFTFRAQTIREYSGESGTIYHFYHNIAVAVRRPDRLHLDISGDLMQLGVWYDGQTFTILDSEKKTYSRTDAPRPIDALLNAVTQRTGVEIPLSDFVVANPYAALTENAARGMDLGMSTIGGVPCHHLAFSREGLGWEIWIEDGDRPVPRRFIITDTRSETTPRFIAELSDWNLAAELSDATFVFSPPAGARQVEFAARPAQ